MLGYVWDNLRMEMLEVRVLGTLEDGEGPGNDCAGGRGGGAGPQSFCCRVGFLSLPQTTHVSYLWAKGWRSMGRGGGTGTWETIARGGEGAIISLYVPEN